MPSFDVVMETSAVELKNAIDQANKEIGNRFDFKGSDSRIELKDWTITLWADDDFKRTQVIDIMIGKISKRQIDPRFLVYEDPQKVSGGKIKQIIQVSHGIDTNIAKLIVKTIKDSKIKVQASIQGDTVRVSGAKRDDLQSTMKLLRDSVKEHPLSFNNFRD